MARNTRPTERRALAAGVLAVALTGCAHHDDRMGSTYHLYFLGGQSNMEGGGLNSEAGDALLPPDGALITAGPVTDDARPTRPATGWMPVTGGSGWGMGTTDGAVALSDRFGPEVTFARRLRELRPHERVAIVKYAKGGTGIDRVAGREWGTWLPADLDLAAPTPNQHDHALAAIASALATSGTDIDGDGRPDTIVPAGIVWMQGETDARHEHAARMYADNLEMLMARLRAALGGADLPVVIGMITDSQRLRGEPPVRAFGEIVEQQQRDVADRDPNALLMDRTLEYGYSDPLHYDTPGFLLMGEHFAEAMHELRTSKAE